MDVKCTLSEAVLTETALGLVPAFAIADIMAAAREGKLEEVFGTGTAAVVSPVKELVWKGEHAYIGDGKIGPVTQKLYDTMTGMQWGKLPDTKGWIVPVEKKN